MGWGYLFSGFLACRPGRDRLADPFKPPHHHRITDVVAPNRSKSASRCSFATIRKHWVQIDSMPLLSSDERTDEDDWYSR
jgi:hypothetical protein